MVRAASWHHGPAAARNRPDLLRLGAASAVWAIIDKVVDDYIPVADGIEDDIEEVENDVFDDDIPAPTADLQLKREVIEFHRAVWPLLSPLEALERGGFERVPEELRRYFRDIDDHASRVDEQVARQRELLTSVLQANLSLVSVNQNDVVKKISAVFGDHRRPDLHRQRLRHELRAHARAALALRLSAYALGRWRCRGRPGYLLQTHRLALGGPRWRVVFAPRARGRTRRSSRFRSFGRDVGRDGLRVPRHDAVQRGAAGAGLADLLLRGRPAR